MVKDEFFLDHPGRKHRSRNTEKKKKPRRRERRMKQLVCIKSPWNRFKGIMLQLRLLLEVTINPNDNKLKPDSQG
jgi:hypothetical protein